MHKLWQSGLMEMFIHLLESLSARHHIIFLTFIKHNIDEEQYINLCYQ